MLNRNARLAGCACTRLAGCALVVGLLLVPEALLSQAVRTGRPAGVNTPRELKARRLLQKRLRRAMASRIARQGKLSVYVKVLRGPTVFARGGNLRVHPASCVKIVTSAVALRKLGVNFKFETVLSGRRQGPALVTPLYVRGQGDPTLTNEDLGRFAKILYNRGIRQIPKGIVVDVTFFDRRRFPPGFGRRSSEGYIAPTGAVSINGNVVKVRVSPQKGKSGCTPKVTVEPNSDHVTLQHTVKCSNTKTRLRASAVRDGNRLKVVVSGNLNENASEKKYDRRVLYPWRFAGETLKTALVGRGIKVGPVRRGRMAQADVLIRHRSEPFSKIVTHMNRQSDNFYAEQVLKTVGAKVFKPPGSTAKGLRALRGLLLRSRVRPGTYVISNGSGLFGQTRMSASQLVRLLSRVTTLDWLYKALLNSLSVAGHSGTLGSRMSGTAASGRVHAKTGTMRSVSTLAGYVRSRSKTGPVVIFAILHNGFPGGVGNSRRLQDEMVLAMARYLDQW